MKPPIIELPIADPDTQRFLARIVADGAFANVQAYLLQLISEDRLRRQQAEKNADSWKDVFDQLQKAMGPVDGTTLDTVILKNQ